MHRGDFLSQLGEGSSGAGRCRVGSASGAGGPTQPLLAVLGTLSWPWASCSVPHPFWEPLRKKPVWEAQHGAGAAGGVASCPHG